MNELSCDLQLTCLSGDGNLNNTSLASSSHHSRSQCLGKKPEHSTHYITRQTLIPMSLSKKSAFSCDQCRKRKVRCGGEQPHCNRCVAREETCEYKLPPTLSYTQKLESRVEELERLVLQLQIPPAKEASGSPQPGSPKPRSGLPPVSFEGLKFDDQGSITYHGATSFFHLPNAASDKPSTVTVSDPSASLDGERIRQRLVSNAWHQRALETFAETPVRSRPISYI